LAKATEFSEDISPVKQIPVHFNSSSFYLMGLSTDFREVG